MRVADFEVVKEARRVAEGQLAFFFRMMAAKRAREAQPPATVTPAQDTSGSTVKSGR